MGDHNPNLPKAIRPRYGEAMPPIQDPNNSFNNGY